MRMDKQFDNWKEKIAMRRNPGFCRGALGLAFPIRIEDNPVDTTRREKTTLHAFFWDH